jgi:glycosyltransferase involved in cell wall biosynthesis
MNYATSEAEAVDVQQRGRTFATQNLRIRIRDGSESLISESDSNRRVKVYVPGPHWFIRPNNTDWRYTQMLGQLGDFDNRLEIFREHSWMQVIDTNLRLILGNAGARLGLKLPDRLRYGLAQYRSLARREVLSFRPDVIFAYERYPRRTDIPVLWMTGPIPEHEFNNKKRQSENDQEIAWKRDCANHAAQVICSTIFAKQAFCHQTACDPDRVHVVPFLLPHLSGGGRPRNAKLKSKKLKCLFVGRDAVRKGLRRALEIIKAAPHWSLHVISSFSDGLVDLPSNVTHQHSASRHEVLEWMAKSDLLFSLSEFDTFGFAAVEAASRQCVPVFRAGSIQETMFSSSAAIFLNDNGTPQTWIDAIENKVITERHVTLQALLSEFRLNFSPERVAHEVHSLGLSAIRCRSALMRVPGTARVEDTYSDGYSRVPQAV